MPAHPDTLPQLEGGLYLTDGGLETTLIFHDGLELPDFAAFHLLADEDGKRALRRYFRTYAELAAQHGTGLVFESATWRANADWGERLGYGNEALAHANREAVQLLHDLREEFSERVPSIVVSGCLGPRGDGYVPGQTMSANAARHYHDAQVRTFADSGVDMVSAITMNYVEEAVGIAQAARDHGLPVAISFTVETDGRLPTGQPLGEAIEQTDRETGGYPAYYMINCAHPSHFEAVLTPGEPWIERIRGLRANASHKSHAELNDSTELDAGDPDELGRQYAALLARLPRLNVMGGCCGTDDRHVDRIAAACAPRFAG